jgi:hypothetical protein
MTNGTSWALACSFTAEEVPNPSLSGKPVGGHHIHPSSRYLGESAGQGIGPGQREGYFAAGRRQPVLHQLGVLAVVFNQQNGHHLLFGQHPFVFEADLTGPHMSLFDRKLENL